MPELCSSPFSWALLVYQDSRVAVTAFRKLEVKNLFRL